MSLQLQLIPSFLITDPLILRYRGLYLTLWALVYERRIVLNPDLNLLKQQDGSKGYLLTLIRAITPAHTHIDEVYRITLRSYWWQPISADHNAHETFPSQ